MNHASKSQSWEEATEGWPTSQSGVQSTRLLARLGCSPENGCGLSLVLPTPLEACRGGGGSWVAFPACHLPCPPPSLKAEGSLVVSCQLRDGQDPTPHQTHRITRRGKRVTQQIGSLLVLWFLAWTLAFIFWVMFSWHLGSRVSNKVYFQYCLCLSLAVL